jgi:hypothetical protein
MRHRHWILAISISALAFATATLASAEPREKQQSLQKLARDIIQSSRVDPEQEQDFQHNTEPGWDWRIHNSSSGASFYVPQTQQRKDGLWYDLGWFKIDELYFEFDRPLGTDSPSDAAPAFTAPGKNVPAPAPPAPAPSAPAPSAPAPSALAPSAPGPSAPVPSAPQPPAASNSSASDGAVASSPVDNEPANADIFDYPLKAQLLVELVREYGARPARRQGAQPLKLDDATLRQIEQIVRDEIKAIETAQQKSRSSGNNDRGNFNFDDVSALLMDYDARITRLVMAQLDAQADKRGLLLRKNRESGAAGGSEPVQIAFKFPAGAGEPNRLLVMCGGNFDYLKSTWNTAPESNLDDKRWKSVQWEKSENKLIGAISPGRQAIVAVWDDNGKIKFARAHN